MLHTSRRTHRAGLLASRASVVASLVLCLFTLTPSPHAFAAPQGKPLPQGKPVGTSRPKPLPLPGNDADGEIPAPKPTPKPTPQPKPSGPGKPIPGKEGKTLALVFKPAAAEKADPVTGLKFPADMPPIVWPEFVGCQGGVFGDKAAAQRAWAMAHHDMWRAYQLVTYIENSQWTKELWGHGYDAAKTTANWSPRAWFGEFEDSLYRYQTVRDAVRMAWNDRFLAKRVSFTIRCRDNDGGAHPCYLKNPGTDRPPSANHIVLGRINLCNRFFDDKDDIGRARTMIHEVFHHLAPKKLYIVDTHTHSDPPEDPSEGPPCKPDTDKMYGPDKAYHLATSNGCLGPDKHRRMAAHNNDNYAFFVLRVGRAVYTDRLKQFPAQSFFDTN